MRKERWIIVAGVLVLFLAGGAQASIGWTQGYTVGATNRVDWFGGIGSVAAENKARWEQKQHFGDAHAGLGAFQRQSGAIVQNASADGRAGPSSSRQRALLQGDQSLGISGGRFPEVRGNQSLGGTLTNVLVKPQGVGHVNGNQHFVGRQEQGFSTPYSSGGQSQYAEVVQRGNITTNVNTDPMVKSKVRLQLDQSQITGGQ